MSWFRRRSSDASAHRSGDAGGRGAAPRVPPGSPPPGSTQREPTPLDVVRAYHERSKHHGHRYAAALGFLDWDNQPDPFRRYLGAPCVPLPRPRQDTTPAFETLYAPGAVPPRSLTLDTLAEFFWYALALSAWKRAGEARWSLRVNPSSGNLHPTEGWVGLPALPGLAELPGLYHYAPREHALECRARWPAAAWSALWTAPDGPPRETPARAGQALPPAESGSFLVALSTVPWREAWKYGERAWRYCQHDAGHALAALRCSAALQGWELRCLSGTGDAPLAALLGLDRAGEFHAEEPEHPELLALVTCSAPAGGARPPALEALAALAAGAQWSGRPNLLSPEHHPWEVLERIEAATRSPAAWSLAPPAPAVHRVAADAAAAQSAPCGRSAGDVIRSRRSAVAMDGRTGLTARGLCAILERVVPALTPQPWDALDWPPLVDLLLFIHRVQDFAPGLYALLREPARAEAVRAALDPSFAWTAPPAAPRDLPLFLLREGDARLLATSVSCGQDIAGRSAFSLGMLAQFEPALLAYGAPIYRHLFRETGFLGQVLYLEAEAAGIAATGIGCFFDDAVHQAAGLRGRSLQSLYHFTVGGALVDERLQSEPAYPEPEGAPP